MIERAKSFKAYWLLETEVLLGGGWLVIFLITKSFGGGIFGTFCFFAVALGIAMGSRYHGRLRLHADAHVVEAPLPFKIFWWIVMCVDLLLLFAPFFRK
jgi:hypothetical protein